MGRPNWKSKAIIYEKRYNELLDYCKKRSPFAIGGIYVYMTNAPLGPLSPQDGSLCVVDSFTLYKGEMVYIIISPDGKKHHYIKERNLRKIDRRIDMFSFEDVANLSLTHGNLSRLSSK